jgi:cation:H+ antiporter
MIETIPYLKLVGGLVYLLLGGDLLVRGAIGLSHRTRISPTVAGLTIVAAGTSAPELMVSMYSAITGFGDIALGNVVGSNIANVLLVLGVPVFISPIVCRDAAIRPQAIFMLAISVLFLILCAFGPLGWPHGSLLLGLLAIGLVLTLRGQFAMPGIDPEEAREQLTLVLGIPASTSMIVLFSVAGILMLPVGADLAVEGAITIASSLGVAEAVVAASMIAIGTSLPELSTTVVAALHRSAGVALGNVIGSNVLNILAIIGATSLVAAIPVSRAFLTFDLWVMLSASLALTALVLRGATLGRVHGAVMLLAYVGYLAMLFRPAL